MLEAHPGHWDGGDFAARSSKRSSPAWTLDSAGLLYLLCLEHVDNLGAYSIPLETGLLIPSENVNYWSADCTAPADPHEQRDAFPSDGVRCVKFSISVWLEIGLGHARIRIEEV